MIRQLTHVKKLTVVLLFALPLVAREFPRDLDTYIEKARRESNVPGLAIAVVDANGVIVTKGYGVRRLGSPELVDADTLFDIASLTKSFNAAMTATLVDEGKLSWDERVRDRLPQVVFPDAMRDGEVTLRDLLAHRVALENGNLFIRLAGYDRDEVFRRIRFFRPQGAFRGDYVYSNVMYSLAGAMAEAAASRPWADLVRERLLEPLGMTSSNALSNLSGPNVASPHAELEGVQQPVPTFRFVTVAPAAAMVSNANDMAKWLQFQLGDGTFNGKRIISAASMEEMHSPQIIINTTPAMRAARSVDFFAGYGFGWNVMDYRGHAMLWHSGNGQGMPVYMAILPKEKIGVVVMVNTWTASTLHGALASRILDSLLGLPTRDYASEARDSYLRGVKRDGEERAAREKARVTGTHPTRPLGEYVGTYVDRLFGDIEITRDGEQLALQFAKGERAVLRHWNYDTFQLQWRDPVVNEDFPALVTFSLDESGKPLRLDMRLRRTEISATRYSSSTARQN